MGTNNKKPELYVYVGQNVTDSFSTGAVSVL